MKSVFDCSSVEDFKEKFLKSEEQFREDGSWTPNSPEIVAWVWIDLILEAPVLNDKEKVQRIKNLMQAMKGV